MTYRSHRVCGKIQKIYTYLMILILAILEVKVLGKKLVLMFAGSVQIISRLNSQSKFQMFTLFSGRRVGGDTPTCMAAPYWAL